MLFKDIDNIDTNVVSILSQSGITDMTDVQAKTYKHISNNKDVIVCSGTGTGKTLAYLCPIISHITGNNNSFKNNNADISSKNNNAGSTVNNKNTYNGHKPTHSKNIQARILVPNGELASQVNHQAEQLFSYEGCPYTSMFVTGEGNINRQIDNLKSKPSILIGTPARICQLINMKKIKVHEVKSLVLDEADKLLGKTYIEHVHSIRKSLMKYTQVLLFSASIDKKTRKEANSLLRRLNLPRQ